MINFRLNEAIKILGKTPGVLTNLLENLPDPWIYNTEGQDTWSPFDIVGHLIHGEKTDWIPRAKIILHYGEKNTFTPFDRFAQFQDSKGKSLKESLHEFKKLRGDNITSLRDLNLTQGDLSKKGIHPEFGEVSLRQLLSTWVTHDLGHIAQITRVMAKQYKTECGPWQRYLPILHYANKK